MTSNRIYYLIPILLLSLLALISISFISYSHISDECKVLNNSQYNLSLQSFIDITSKFNDCFIRNKLPILIIHMTGFIFFQTWCIPGTIFFNLFAGACFELHIAFFLCLLVSKSII